MLMDRALIELFEDNRVPRYTSYPTAPHFKQALTKTEHQTLLRSVDPAKPLSLYLHVPFCHQLCWYCGCTTKVVNKSRPVDRYAELLLREIDLMADQLAAHMAHPPRLAHIHWGGGTPSILGGERFDQLMHRIAERFRIANHAEIAVELDPRHLDADMIAAMVMNGVNRVSFGIQSFDPQVQEAINRVQSFGQVQDCVHALRRAGIANISFDLLYGLPDQTLDSCKTTIDQALLLAPDRFAVFAYAHLPSRIKHQRLIPQEALPDASQRVAQYVAIRETLIQRGYHAVGIDHFAKPEDPLAIAQAKGELRRNFQGYTADACDQLIGLGASSISSLKGGYLQNHIAMQDYANAIEDGQLPVKRGLPVSSEDLCRRAIIEAVMCQGEVDLTAIAERFNVKVSSIQPEPNRLARLEACGLVHCHGNRFTMQADRQPFVRVLAACFDQYLDPKGALHAAAL